MQKYPKHIRTLVIITVIFLIFFDVFYSKGSSDLGIGLILFFYTFFIIRLKIGPLSTFIICLLLFSGMYAQYVLSAPSIFASQYPVIPFGEKFAVWLYIFLIIGLIQKFFSHKNR